MLFVVFKKKFGILENSFGKQYWNVDRKKFNYSKIITNAYLLTKR